MIQPRRRQAQPIVRACETAPNAAPSRSSRVPAFGTESLGETSDATGAGRPGQENAIPAVPAPSDAQVSTRGKVSGRQRGSQPRLRLRRPGGPDARPAVSGRSGAASGSPRGDRQARPDDGRVNRAVSGPDPATPTRRLSAALSRLLAILGEYDDPEYVELLADALLEKHWELTLRIAPHDGGRAVRQRRGDDRTAQTEK